MILLAQDSESPLFRASFNFTSKCNLSCRFCYIPFDSHTTDDQISMRVVARLAELGAKSITFGGGDPLKYQSLVKLLVHAREVGISHIQVDTNALGWSSKELLSQVGELVNVVGLPLDGPTPEVHAAMRSHRRSWADSISAAVFLKGRTAVKINTVVGAPNIGSLSDLANMVNWISPQIWSIYEFWEVGRIAQENSQLYALNGSEFVAAAESIRSMFDVAETYVEVGRVDERSPSYFFVTDTGSVYAIDPYDSSKYSDLGSVFDDKILERWLRVADADRNFKRTAQRFGLH